MTQEELNDYPARSITEAKVFALPSLLYVLAAGGYVTSVLKDLFCVPRPYSPPLVRLSVGTHALEYGFPSTHST